VKVEFQSNLDAFNRALGDYVHLSRLSTQEAVKKQGAKFAFDLSTRLQAFAPGKGAIRAERLAALRSGQGLRISDAARKRVYSTKGIVQDIKTKKFGFTRGKKVSGTRRLGGKRLNIQALLVKAEIGLRESGRGFLSYSSKVRSLIQKFAIKDDVDYYQQHLDRYSRFLTSVGFRTDADKANMTFGWGGNKSSDKVAKALSKPRQQRAIASSLDAIRADMMAYIVQRQARAKQPLRSI
jgi:hypothetical protein